MSDEIEIAVVWLEALSSSATVTKREGETREDDGRTFFRASSVDLAGNLDNGP